MSRSGLIEDCEDVLAFGRWRGNVRRSLRSKRGQEFLRELLAAMDAMPEKRLVRDALEHEGEVCALGVVYRARGIDAKDRDLYEAESVANILNISHPMAAEIIWENDDRYVRDETPEQRWARMRKWVEAQIAKTSG